MDLNRSGLDRASSMCGCNEPATLLSLIRLAHPRWHSWTTSGLPLGYLFGREQAEKPVSSVLILLWSPDPGYNASGPWSRAAWQGWVLCMSWGLLSCTGRRVKSVHSPNLDSLMSQTTYSCLGGSVTLVEHTQTHTHTSHTPQEGNA